MFAEMLKQPRALVVSLVMHLAVIGLMVLNLSFVDRAKDIKGGQLAKTVQAEMVDLKEVEQQKHKIHSYSPSSASRLSWDCRRSEPEGAALCVFIQG